MIPSLLVHDHILVNKLAYGVRVPFSKQWLIKGDNPGRGDIVVFRAKNESYFMVKRVLGLPGETLRFYPDGRVSVDGKVIERSELGEVVDKQDQGRYYPVDSDDVKAPFRGLEFFEEDSGNNKYRTMQILGGDRPEFEIEIPDDHIFMMGDNRDNSKDSRFWGPLPINHVLGRATFVWLSCDETLPVLSFLCNPLELRWSRFGHSVK
jgi:signal peptidase I